MMHYSVLDDCVQALFEQYVPLSQAQQECLSQFCCSQLLAGSSQLPQLANWLGRSSQQAYGCVVYGKRSLCVKKLSMNRGSYRSTLEPLSFRA